MSRKTSSRSAAQKLTTQVFHVLSARDGGMGLGSAIDALDMEGIEATPAHSVLVGHVAVAVVGTPRLHREVERVLFGSSK